MFYSVASQVGSKAATSLGPSGNSRRNELSSWNMVERLGYGRLQARHLELPGPRHDPRLNVLPNPSKKSCFPINGRRVRSSQECPSQNPTLNGSQP